MSSLHQSRKGPTEDGRVPEAPGSRPTDGAASVSTLSGFDPSRDDWSVGSGCELCRDEDGEQWYPLYGVAPHECYWRKGPEFSLGQSTLKPITPEDCFVPELERGEGWSDFVYPKACGVY